MPTRYVPSVSMVVLGAVEGGGGGVTVTVFVITWVDVTVIAVWLDPPQPARTIAAAAKPLWKALFFPCIDRRVNRQHTGSLPVGTQVVSVLVAGTR